MDLTRNGELGNPVLSRSGVVGFISNARGFVLERHEGRLRSQPSADPPFSWVGGAATVAWVVELEVVVTSVVGDVVVASLVPGGTVDSVVRDVVVGSAASLSVHVVPVQA